MVGREKIAAVKRRGDRRRADSFATRRALEWRSTEKIKNALNPIKFESWIMKEDFNGRITCEAAHPIEFTKRGF